MTASWTIFGIFENNNWPDFTPSFHWFPSTNNKITSKYAIFLNIMISGLWRINMWARLLTKVFILISKLSENSHPWEFRKSSILLPLVPSLAQYCNLGYYVTPSSSSAFALAWRNYSPRSITPPRFNERFCVPLRLGANWGHWPSASVFDQGGGVHHKLLMFLTWMGSLLASGIGTSYKEPRFYVSFEGREQSK
jgi:hypothetical protein